MVLRNWLALVGLLFILASTFLGIAWAQYWKATGGRVADLEEMGIWLSVQSSLGITPDLALASTLAGLLLGIMMTIPWWRERLRRENVWWEKRGEPLDTPPRGGV
jgi:hypothetical protein